MGTPMKEKVQIFSNLGIRVPPELRQDTKNQAGLAGLSLNQYSADALAHYNALQRARREKMNDQQQQIELVK
jgi:predicted HicB family RNase H-like nuclease